MPNSKGEHSYEELQEIFNRGESVILDGVVYNKTSGSDLPKPEVILANDPEAMSDFEDKLQAEADKAAARLEEFRSKNQQPVKTEATKPVKVKAAEVTPPAPATPPKPAAPAAPAVAATPAVPALPVTPAVPAPATPPVAPSGAVKLPSSQG